jgi:membrane associated rhomboid family serine protease
MDTAHRDGNDRAMDKSLSARILIAISIVYGLTIAVLGWSGSAAVGGFAFIGGLVIGGLWAMRALFIRS